MSALWLLCYHWLTINQPIYVIRRLDLIVYDLISDVLNSCSSEPFLLQTSLRLRLSCLLFLLQPLHLNLIQHQVVLIHLFLLLVFFLLQLSLQLDLLIQVPSLNLHLFFLHLLHFSRKRLMARRVFWSVLLHIEELSLGLDSFILNLFS